MLRFALCCCVLGLAMRLPAQTLYTLTYRDSASHALRVRIQPAAPLKKPLCFVMPRAIPGSYSISLYDQFVRNLYAVDAGGARYALLKDKNDAPRWYGPETEQPIVYLEYEADLDAQERKTSAAEASIIRPGFAGALNYAVFGWIEGLEGQPVRCKIDTWPNWPIFSTHAPTADLPKGVLEFEAANYAQLADGQIFMGPMTRVRAFAGPVPLYVASYAQTEAEYLDDYGRQGLISLDILKDYFGELPFPHYSILLRKALPLEPVHAPTLAMEHLQSATFFGDTSGLRRGPMREETLRNTLPTFLHHMGHAFIPLRCYGDAYRPYPMEIPPVINHIWFNEGFIWFLLYDTLRLERLKKGFYSNVYETAPAIKQLTLTQLSQTASTMYGLDFRLGRAVFSRGALMAMEMDAYLKEKTGGAKTMKDVLRYLYQWSKREQRPFTLEEFPELLRQAGGVDLGPIYQKWQRPTE